MKKTTISLLTLLALLFVSPVQMRAATDPDSAAVEVAAQTAHVNTLVARVEEIQAMDFSSLSRSERRELKRELNSIQRELKAEGVTATTETSTGVYISFGALIIIILLLIILL